MRNGEAEDKRTLQLQCTDYELFSSLAEVSVKMSHDTQSAVLNLSHDDLMVTFSSQIVFLIYFFLTTSNKSIVMQCYTLFGVETAPFSTERQKANHRTHHRTRTCSQSEGVLHT